MNEAAVIARAAGLRPWRSPAELAAYQEERLRRAVAHAHASVPYYRELFDRHGVHPAQIRTLDDLHRLPVSSKTELRAQPVNRVLATGYDPARLGRIHTTGSTGEPFVLYRAPPEKWRHQLFRLRALRAAGHRLGDCVVQIRTMRSRTRPKLEIGGGVLRAAGLRGHVLDVSAPPGEILDEAAALRPAIVSTYPSMLARLGEELQRSGRADLRPRLVVSGGEVLTKARRRQIEAAWGVPVFEGYGCFELDVLAWQCQATGLLHVCDDSVVLEVVTDGRPAAVGERGEVVLTGLHARSMPFIRYRLGDLAVRGPRTCPCGHPFGTIAGIQGRMLDLFRLRGGRLVHPYEILCDLREDAFRWVRHYQLVQEAEDRIVFLVVPGPEFGRERLAEFECRAARVLGGDARLRVELVDRIEPGPGGKFHLARSLVRSGEEPGWHRSEPVA